MSELRYFFVFLAVAGATALGSVPYSTRPVIESIPAAPMSHPPARWHQYREACLRYLAELLALHPNEPIYFLARDTEPLYDLARVLFQDRPEVLARLHLLNVSTVSRQDDHFRDYVAEQGPRIEELVAGRAVVVDSGKEGSHISHLTPLYPTALRDRIIGYLIASDVPHRPSSFVFLETLDPELHRPEEFFELVHDFERLPHYHAKTTHYERRNGAWEACSDDEAPEEFRNAALALMADLRLFGESERARFFEMLRDMSSVAAVVAKRDEWRASSVEGLARLRVQGVRSFERDAEKSSQLGHLSALPRIELPAPPRTLRGRVSDCVRRLLQAAGL